MTALVQKSLDIWQLASDKDVLQVLAVMESLPARVPGDLDTAVDAYRLALDGVSRWALHRAVRDILQNSLGHPYMPSPPELRGECDRIMLPFKLAEEDRIAAEQRQIADDAAAQIQIEHEPPPIVDIPQAADPKHVVPAKAENIHAIYRKFDAQWQIDNPPAQRQGEGWAMNAQAARAPEDWKRPHDYRERSLEAFRRLNERRKRDGLPERWPTWMNEE